MMRTENWPWDLAVWSLVMWTRTVQWNGSGDRLIGIGLRDNRES